MNKNLKCANCGCYIENEYYKVLDNYLLVKYFDCDEDNIFCSQDCLCESLSVEHIEIKE
jgi:hypothetical protein